MTYEFSINGMPPTPQQRDAMLAMIAAGHWSFPELDRAVGYPCLNYSTRQDTLTDTIYVSIRSTPDRSCPKCGRE